MLPKTKPWWGIGADFSETESIQSLEWHAPQGRWEEYGKDKNCSADVKVRPIPPRKHPSQFLECQRRASSQSHVLHTKASQSKRFSLTDIAGIILLFPLRGCIFHDSVCKLSSNDNLELQIYRWLMGIQPYSQPHQLDALVSLQQYAEALFLHCKPQCSHTLQQCWWFHFPL